MHILLSIRTRGIISQLRLRVTTIASFDHDDPRSFSPKDVCIEKCPTSPSGTPVATTSAVATVLNSSYTTAAGTITASYPAESGSATVEVIAAAVAQAREAWWLSSVVPERLVHASWESSLLVV